MEVVLVGSRSSDKENNNRSNGSGGMPIASEVLRCTYGDGPSDHPSRPMVDKVHMTQRQPGGVHARSAHETGFLLELLKKRCSQSEQLETSTVSSSLPPR